MEVLMKTRFVLLAVLPGACAAVGVPGDLADSQAAIGETTCETAVKNADGTPFHESGGNWPGSGDWTASSDSTYGTTDCPDQYLVGYGATSGGYRTGWAKWTDAMPSDEPTCENSYLAVSLYVLITGYGWVENSVTVAGIWNPSGSCDFGDVTHPRIASTIVDPERFMRTDASHLRVAASAFSFDWTCQPPGCLPHPTYHTVATAASYADP
jgi:hypothetical protein